MGFKQAVVQFDAPARMSGKSKYTLKKMIRFAWDGVTSFSSKPLKISMVFGVLSLFFGLLYAIYTIVVFLLGKAIPGWTSMMLVILFLGGIQLLSLGIIGEYLSRIFSESKNRPHYFISNRC
jgi:dolichol-phosphate mannosyltransferase